LEVSRSCRYGGAEVWREWRYGGRAGMEVGRDGGRVGMKVVKVGGSGKVWRRVARSEDGDKLWRQRQALEVVEGSGGG
jgi:hypothetical protein